MTKIKLDGGKYTVVNELSEGGGLKALRYGEEWRNLAGDNLVLAMFHEIERLQDEISEAKSMLSSAHSVLDDVHCYDTDEYNEISDYLYGDDNDE